MEKQKNKPRLRFPVFKEDWQTKSGDLVFESVSNKNHNSDLPILAITQEQGAMPRHLINYNISVTDKSIESYKVVEATDFIISLRSFQGGIEFSNYKGICSPAYIVLQPVVEIDRTFFKYYFKTPRYIKRLTKNLEGIRDGKMISFKYFSEAKLTFPSIPEQKRIASFFTVLDKKIAELKQKKILLEQYKKGVMQKLFSQELRFKDENGKEFPKWEKKKLGEVVKINQGLQIPISERLTEKAEGSYFYITNEFLRVNSEKKYFIKDPSQSVICNKDDILMTRTGNTGVVITNVEGAFHNNFFKIAYPKFINKGFLFYFLNLAETQNLIIKMAGTSTIPDLNHSDFYSIKMPILDILEQTKIANFLSAIDEKINRTETQIQQTQQYKKGLLQNMFI